MTIRKDKLIGSSLTALSVLIAIVTLFPIIWALAVSLKQEGCAMAKEWEWFFPPYTLKNYPDLIFNSKVLVWFLNSLFVSVVTTALVILICSMAAFAISKLKFRYKKFIFLLFLAGIMIPGEATIIPLFVTANSLNLIDTYAGLILPALAGSMNIIIMVSFFNSVPNAIIESVQIDGGNNFVIYTRIILPLVKTVLVTVSIFTFVGNWNSFLWPFLCALNDTLFTLPVGIPTFMGQYSVDFVKPMTANMVASIPAILIFLFFEKYIVKGVNLSGIKM